MLCFLRLLHPRKEAYEVYTLFSGYTKLQEDRGESWPSLKQTSGYFMMRTTAHKNPDKSFERVPFKR